jgi:hypothetical protein
LHPGKSPEIAFKSDSLDPFAKDGAKFKDDEDAREKRSVHGVHFSVCKTLYVKPRPLKARDYRFAAAAAVVLVIIFAGFAIGTLSK